MAQAITKTLLDGVVADGDSIIVDTIGHTRYTLQIDAVNSGSPAGVDAVVTWYGSVDGVTFESIEANTLSTAGATFNHNCSSTGLIKVYKKLKVTVSSWVKGSLTAQLFMTGHGGPAY